MTMKIIVLWNVTLQATHSSAFIITSIRPVSLAVNPIGQLHDTQVKEDIELIIVPFCYLSLQPENPLEFDT
jgi:hypothetical protein